MSVCPLETPSAGCCFRYIKAWLTMFKAKSFEKSSHPMGAVNVAHAPSPVSRPVMVAANKPCFQRLQFIEGAG